MKLRKRDIFSFVISVILALFVLITLSGCGISGSKLVEGKTNIVTSFYPLYFLTKEIGGEQANVINIMPAGVEPHDWSPKSRDLDTVSKAQLFIYNGAGLEGWVDNFLHGLSKDNSLVTLQASAGIPLLAGNPEESTDEKDHTNVDPHTWVSPKSMRIMSKNILASLIKVDPVHRSEYESNEAKLQEKLTVLDDAFHTKLSVVSKKDIVTSHQAFGYLARDYGLHQVAIMGLSPDAEPKAQDLLRIAKFIKGNKIKYIFFEVLVTEELAKTLARETGAQTLMLNPLEGLTPDQEKRGEDYFSLMHTNLQNLLQALQ